MEQTFEWTEIDEREAREVVGGLLIPNFLDALQKTAAEASFLMSPIGDVLN